MSMWISRASQSIRIKPREKEKKNSNRFSLLIWKSWKRGKAVGGATEWTNGTIRTFGNNKTVLSRLYSENRARETLSWRTTPQRSFLNIKRFHWLPHANHVTSDCIAWSHAIADLNKLNDSFLQFRKSTFKKGHLANRLFSSSNN